ncbi:flagellar motor switch protein FliM [Haliea sp.]|uniref:flagellar motor switch protein FliM n=1 Tax=Haliea sp. TaxID=1932666 RepID=UPI0035292417
MAGSDLLSEGELDALTGGNTAGSGGYRTFDFTAREQSLLNQLTLLPPLQERQAEQLAQGLEDVFGSEFEVAAAGLRVLSCEELLASLAESVAVSTLELAPLAGHGHVVCPAPLLSQLVNDYFGGVRGGSVANLPRTALTPSELRLAERVAEQVTGSLVAAWADKLPLEPGEAHTAPHVDAIASLPSGDKLVQMVFAVTLNELTTDVALLLPFAALEPWKQRFSAPRKAAAEDAGQGWGPHLRRELPAVKVDVAVMLASRELTLGEVLGLRVGSVIDIAVPDEVDLCVEGVRLASGRYGAYEGHKAIKITGFAGTDAPAGKSTG